MTTLYEDLGVSKKATLEEMKRAYQRRATGAHPDKKGGNTAKFQKLKKAFDVLSNPERKKQYDETGITNKPFPLDVQAFDIISNLYLQKAQESNFKRKDYFSVIRNELNNILKSNEVTLSKLKAAKENLSYLIKHTKGNQLILIKLQGTLEKVKADVYKCKEHTRLLKHAVQCVDKCEYNGEEITEFSSTSTFYMSGTF